MCIVYTYIIRIHSVYDKAVIRLVKAASSPCAIRRIFPRKAPSKASYFSASS